MSATFTKDERVPKKGAKAWRLLNAGNTVIPPEIGLIQMKVQLIKKMTYLSTIINMDPDC